MYVGAVINQGNSLIKGVFLLLLLHLFLLFST